MKKSKRARALDISPRVRAVVYARDGERCIFCGAHVSKACASAHYIPRSKGGLGVERNILTLCLACHYTFDNCTSRAEKNSLNSRAEAHLKKHYPDWDISQVLYSTAILGRVK